jgi:hypothetical protein
MQFGLNSFVRWPGAAIGRSLFLPQSNWKGGMVTFRTGAPQQPETPDPVSLTKWQKVIGVCLLIFYLTMIAVTIATLPYVADNVASRSTFE